MQEPTEVLATALAWLEAGRKVALATVVETCGSSPRPVGSNLVVGESIIMDFAYTDAEAWDVGLACGGSIQVFVERIE